MRTFYLVMKIYPWSSLTTTARALKAPDSGGMGFCVVFDTEEEARREFPDSEIQEVTEGRSDDE